MAAIISIRQIHSLDKAKTKLGIRVVKITIASSIGSISDFLLENPQVPNVSLKVLYELDVAAKRAMKSLKNLLEFQPSGN